MLTEEDLQRLTEEDLQRLTEHNQFNDKVITGTRKLRHTLYVTVFWKIDQIVALGLFHFIGPANGYTSYIQIHSVITRLG